MVLEDETERIWRPSIFCVSYANPISFPRGNQGIDLTRASSLPQWAYYPRFYRHDCYKLTNSSSSLPIDSFDEANFSISSLKSDPEEACGEHGMKAVRPFLN